MSERQIKTEARAPLRIVYTQSSSLSPPEIEKRIDAAFDILFEEILKNMATEKAVQQLKATLDLNKICQKQPQV